MRSSWEESKGLTAHMLAPFALTWASELRGKFWDPTFISMIEREDGSSLPILMPESCCLKEETTSSYFYSNLFRSISWMFPPTSSFIFYLSFFFYLLICSFFETFAKPKSTLRVRRGWGRATFATRGLERVKGDARGRVLLSKVRINCLWIMTKLNMLIK